MRVLPPTIACLLVLAAGCDLAEPVAQQREASKEAVEANELRDHIQQPIDRAESANDPVIEADKRREQELKDAGG